MRRVWSTLFARECAHKHTIVVKSVGVERTVCEDCGHLSFVISPKVSPSRRLLKRRERQPLRRVSGL